MSDAPLLASHVVESPAVRAAGEDYATFEQLTTLDDVPEGDIRVPWWGGRVIRVRGLSTVDEAAIERAGRIAAAAYRRTHPDDLDPPTTEWDAEYVEVLVRGFVAPKLNAARAQQLLEKNARGIDEVVRYIRLLNRLNYDAIRGHAEARADARTPDASDTE